MEIGLQAIGMEEKRGINDLYVDVAYGFTRQLWSPVANIVGKEIINLVGFVLCGPYKISLIKTNTSLAKGGRHFWLSIIRREW